MLSINRFLAGLFVLVLIGLYSSFAIYYVKEQNTKAELITENYHQILNETSYILSTELKNIQAIAHFKSLFNRKVAQNNLIKAIIVAKQDQILLTTDPAIKNIPAKNHTHSNLNLAKVDISSSYKTHSQKFDYYKQNEQIELTIYLYPNQYALQNYFSETSSKYLIYSVLPTFIIAVILYWIFRIRLINPLEKLRKFAYYHDRVPEKLKIRELETIRSSMLQTFQRLGEESRALYHSARTDELSGLPNRQQLNERLTWLIEEASRNETEFAYLFVDIDNFKNINDTLGHDAGDELLIKIADIMESSLRGYDIIARFGGDEFVMVINQYASHIELNHIIQRVLDKLAQEQIIRNHAINVSASIGVAFYPKDGENAQSLMKNADIAMYEAKKLGKNQVHYFTETLNNKILFEVEMENQLRTALQNQEFELYYQPKVEIKSGKVVGAESLIRWNHPTKGMVSPLEFIPLAEQTGLIIPLGDWILQQAIQQQMEWQKEHQFQIPVSVNVSAMQFSHPHFFQKLRDLIYKSDFNPQYLDIEVTESVLMQNTEEHLTLLKKIRGTGITTSLDDFGTGYSSLAYLKNFPINTLKIDKSFLDDYASHSGSVFIQTIVNMAHNLKINVVAEGVERPEQLEFLKVLDCEVYQGYLCSKPLPNKDFIDLVNRTNKPLAT
ncbi:hypothetical protein THMIRHAM_00900 [Thiomicrorhabdus immobilis]|uniref:Diguanylate cyclase/phosphodiesterase n=1 Tax=Thiomicrorhabdus immobilis TaxID=2791037 RepID=A0ABM7MAI7_9GAMM|nr:EAL domain-containing protein [Thiomicrorhabdus immobilis]BCN92305.1 hypothetical protein THMIRHAM_00900 [Thiomicrorhabdus immobilis]